MTVDRALRIRRMVNQVLEYPFISIKKFTMEVFLILFLVDATYADSPSTYDIFISTKGSDRNFGTYDSPLFSLQRARDLIRKLRADGTIDSGTKITVNIREGEYYINNTLEFNENDSGSKNNPIILSAYNGEEVRLIGAVKIPLRCIKENRNEVPHILHEKYRDDIKIVDLRRCLGINTPAFSYKKDIPQHIETLGTRSPPELFYGDNPMTVARWPNRGWAFTGDAIGNNRFTFYKINAELWEKSDTWLVGYWKWDWFDEGIKLKSIRDGKVTLSHPPYYGIESGRRFFVINSLSELDREGEYYIDTRKGVMYFLPYKKGIWGDLYISVLNEPLVKFQDSRNIVLKGINFEMTRGTGIYIQNGENVKVLDSIIRNTGTTGVLISGGSGHVIDNVEIYNTGTSGVVVVGGDRSTLTAASHIISNNDVHHYGRRIATIYGGIEVRGVGVIVLNNHIHHAPHMGIRFLGNDHLIYNNIIHDVCQETSDAGAIYTGRDWTSRGTKIYNNIIYNINGFLGKGDVTAIYLDDFASGTVIYGNLISNAYRGILIGGGRDNIVSKNIIYKTQIPYSIDSRGTGWAEAHLRKGGALIKKLEEVPYQSSLWKKKYPNLYDILDDSPEVPKRNFFFRNIISLSGNASISAPPSSINIDNDLYLKRKIAFANGIEELSDPGKELAKTMSYPGWFERIYQDLMQ